MSLSELPAMHRLLGEPDVAGYRALLGSTVVKAAVDDVLSEARRAGVPPYVELVARVRARLAQRECEGLVDVINATGVLLHTNLGRAPLSEDALEAVRAAAAASNLELDLATGARGSRYERASALLRAAAGAEDALVVNNCAAAVLLVVDTFARDGREIVVSRGELFEIGGGLRLPDVLQRTGATLVEVGTSNKTYLADFERALSPRTALLVRTHPANVRLEGFAQSPSVAEVAALGKRAGVTTFEDLGSGALVDLERFGLPHERTVQEAIADGIDLVAFSGDKLLGGPQAGIIAGKAAAVARLRANPLLRALRVDKMTLAALAATLRAYLVPDALETVPLYAMLGAGIDALRARATRTIATVRGGGLRPGVSLELVDTRALTGGGTLPAASLPSVAIALGDDFSNPNALLGALRAETPRVIGRADGDRALLDVRSFAPAHDASVAAALGRVLRA